MYTNFHNDNSSGRSAIYRLPTRKLLVVDRIFIYGFVSLISVVTGNGNPLHIYHTMLNFISVLFCNAYIIFTFRVRVRVEVWRFGVAVTRWS